MKLVNGFANAAVAYRRCPDLKVCVIFLKKKGNRKVLWRDGLSIDIRIILIIIAFNKVKHN